MSERELIQIDGSDHHWFGTAGRPAPCPVLDKDQHVTHAAITENKRLGAVLEFIKEEQNKGAPKKAALANNARATNRMVPAMAIGTPFQNESALQTTKPAKAAKSEGSALSGFAPVVQAWGISPNLSKQN